MKRFTLMCATLSLLAAPLLAAKGPAWTRGPDAKYPDDTYLTGVGIGDDLEAARSNARAEISKIFRSRVEQVSSDKLSETSARTGKRATPAEIQQSAEMHTQVSTDSLLEGVTIADTWFDKKKKKYYALALLNKSKSRAALASEIADREAGLRDQLSRASSGSAIDKARAAAKALQLAEERDALVARRRVVDATATPDAGGAGSTAEADRALRDALAQIQFVVDAENGGDSHLKDAVSSKITGLGFDVVDSTAVAKGSAMKLRCRLAVEPYDRGNPNWKFFRWTGSLELWDGARLVSTAGPVGSEGSLLEDTARRKTQSAGEEALAREAEARVSQYIFGK